MIQKLYHTTATKLRSRKLMRAFFKNVKTATNCCSCCTLQHGLIQTMENAIHPLQHTQAHRYQYLTCGALIDNFAFSDSQATKAYNVVRNRKSSYVTYNTIIYVSCQASDWYSSPTGGSNVPTFHKSKKKKKQYSCKKRLLLQVLCGRWLRFIFPAKAVIYF